MREHCRHGHELTPENVYVAPRGDRQCRTCRRTSKAMQVRRPPQPERAALNIAVGVELAMTREEIADRLGVTPSRVGQIERRALEKMRAEAERRGLDIGELLRP